VIFYKMLLLCDKFKVDNGVDEKTLVKIQKKLFIEKMCLIIIRAGSETIVGWKTIMVSEKGKIFVDGTFPCCKKIRPFL